MKKIISIFIILLLTSCSSVGRFGAGVDITFDPRTIGMQIDDTIMQKNLSARLALAEKKYFLSIQSEVLDGRIFLSGKVDEPEEKTLDKFTADIALLTDADKDNDPNNNNKVSLMTIHASKGLEYPFVYIVGLEENLFPSQLSLSSRPDLEEERRLFYVALTRAEKKVSLSYAVSRFRWGNLVHSEPSRFIDEIPEKHLDVTSSKPSINENSIPSQTWNKKPLLRRSTNQQGTVSRTDLRSRKFLKRMTFDMELQKELGYALSTTPLSC